MRTLHPFVAAALGAAFLPAQGLDHAAWIQQRFPDLTKVTAPALVQAAQRAGIATTPAELLALKRAFGSLRERKGSEVCVAPVLLDMMSGPVPAPGIADQVATEVEFNDGVHYADPIGGNAVATGDCRLSNDVDYWSIVGAGDFVTAEVAPTGTFPITDSILGLRTRTGQLMAFNDDVAPGFMSRVAAYLPPGLFHLEVAGWNSTSGGQYNLNITRAPVTLQTLQPGSGNNGTTAAAASAQTVWQFTLAGDALVDIQVASTTGDLALSIQRSDGRVWFMNDDSGRGGLNPGADIDLPAGTYFLHVLDNGGTGGLPYTITYAATPFAMPELCSAGSGGVTGTILGKETRRLYRLGSTRETIDLLTGPGPLGPVGDTILHLFDADLNYLCDVDDYDPTNSSNYYARITMGLPQGIYYVGVRGYDISIGDFTLVATCGAPFPTPATARYGRNTLNVPGNGGVQLSNLEVCSPNVVRLDSNGGFASSFYGFMDSAGRSLGVFEWSGPGVRQGQAGRARSRETSTVVPRGTVHVLSWYRFQAGTTMSLDILPPLSCETGSLVSRGKAGDLAFLFGAFAPAPGINFGVEEGFFCLPFPSTSLLTLGLQFLPASGNVTWFPCPTQSYGVFVQQGDLYQTPTPLLGAWRNRLPL